MTEQGLDIAKKRVRYSGSTIVRLFTAASGPRGVRTSLKDYTIDYSTGSMTITGISKRASYTAAVGFLGRNGAFVPMARALPIWNF
jgi:hypothetical protein